MYLFAIQLVYFVELQFPLDMHQLQEHSVKIRIK